MDPPANVFEGVEKRIEIRFEPAQADGLGLRALGRNILDELCSKCKCAIIHHDETEFYDAYILSESSLFVFRDKVMIKTCGTTVPLEGVDFLVTQARVIGALPVDMTYTRSSFLFPDLQLQPHNDLNTELQYLSDMNILGRKVPGKSSILGDSNGKYWLVHYKNFLTDSSEKDVPVVTPQHASSRCLQTDFQSGQIMVDIIMTGIDKAACDLYHKDPSKSDEDNENVMGNSLRSMLPEFETISGKCYDPCGYSCNAFSGDRYFTVHITPEEAFSYASVEAVFAEGCDVGTPSVLDFAALNHSTSRSTVASETEDSDSSLAKNVTSFIQNVTSIFKPRETLVTMLVRGEGPCTNVESVASQLPEKFSINGDKAKSRTVYTQQVSPLTSENLLGEDIVASSVFYSSVSSGNTGNKPPGLS